MFGKKLLICITCCGCCLQCYTVPEEWRGCCHCHVSSRCASVVPLVYRTCFVPAAQVVLVFSSSFFLTDFCPNLFEISAEIECSICGTVGKNGLTCGNLSSSGYGRCERDVVAQAEFQCSHLLALRYFN